MGGRGGVAAVARAGRRFAQLTVLSAVVAGLTLPGSAFAEVALESSTPAIGARVANIDEVRLRFSGPVLAAPGAFRLVDVRGRGLPTGPAIVSDDGTVVVPVVDRSPGLRALSWRLTEAASNQRVSGAITFDVGSSPSPSLNAAGAESASAGSSLARSTAVVALAVLLAGLVLIVRARGVRAQPRQLPASAFVGGASAALALAGALGLVFGTRSATITGRSLPLFTALCVLAIVLAGGVLLTWRLPRIRGRPAVAAGAASALALGLAFVTAGLPKPIEGDFEARAPLAGALQASVRISPGGVGANALTLDIGGPPDAVRRARDAGDLSTVFALVRPLDGRIGPMRIPITPAGTEGGFRADALLLPTAGRWRAELHGIPSASQTGVTVFDFTVQPNAEVS